MAEGAQERLAALIQKACGRKEADLDSSLLTHIKALCKQSDDNVLFAWEALWAQLRAPHSQVTAARQQPAGCALWEPCSRAKWQRSPSLCPFPAD